MGPHRSAEILPALNNDQVESVLILIEVFRKMKYFAALALGFVLSTTTGLAQFRGSLPLAPGDSFPEIDVHDADGAKLNTRSLKGKYTVVVNGCLT